VLQKVEHRNRWPCRLTECLAEAYALFLKRLIATFTGLYVHAMASHTAEAKNMVVGMAASVPAPVEQQTEIMKSGTGAAQPTKSHASAATSSETSKLGSKKPLQKKNRPDPGMKFVKVRFPDGVIRTVQRPLTEADKAAIGAKKAAQSSAAETVKDVPTKVGVSTPVASKQAPAKAGAVAEEKETTSRTGGSSNTTESQAEQNKTLDSEPITTIKKAAPKSTSTKAITTVSESTPETNIVIKEIEVHPNSSVDLDAALEEQNQKNRTKRMSQFKNSLINGTARVFATMVPSAGLEDWHHGDEAVDCSDYSDLSDDDHDMEGHEHDNHDHNLEQNHSHHNEEGPPSYQSNNDHSSMNVPTGALAQTAAAQLTAKSGANEEKAAPANNGATTQPTDKKDPTQKVTYIQNIKELEEIEKANLEKHKKPLGKHWADASFYLLASLSIVLPIIFLVLGIVMLLARKKSVDSAWGDMEQIIKGFTTAWPIIFAAVVAQAFKACATYQVERGIKLSTLEQLVGSNSFAGAMKQPFFLRRIEFTTLLIFVIWCLSPIGSSALQRALIKDQPVTVVNSNTSAPNGQFYYMSTTGINSFFSKSVVINRTDAAQTTQRSDDLALLGGYFNSLYLPASLYLANDQKYDYQDSYGYPLLQIAADFNTDNWSAPGGMGIPLKMEPRGDPRTPSSLNYTSNYNDTIIIPLSTSYFNFSCEDYTTVSGGQPYMNNLDWSSNFQFGLAMNRDPTVNRSDISPVADEFSNTLLFMSRNRIPADPNPQTTSGIPALDGPWDANDTVSFSQIKCHYDRNFVNYTMLCSRNDVIGGLPICKTSEVQFWKTALLADPANDAFRLMDFGYEFLQYGAPVDPATTAINPSKCGSNTRPLFLISKLINVIVENFLYIGSAFPTETDGVDPANNLKEFKLTDGNDSGGFAQALRYLFNSFVTPGFCLPCYLNGTGLPTKIDPIYVNASSTTYYEFRDATEYDINKAWFSVYMISSGFLLIVGVIATAIESMTVAPDILGYASNVARNSRYLHLPPTTSDMKGSQRLRTIKDTEVMLQDVKGKAAVGKIALGNKFAGAERIKRGRVYR
jgi:hypothetical protein